MVGAVAEVKQLTNHLIIYIIYNHVSLYIVIIQYVRKRKKNYIYIYYFIIIIYVYVHILHDL